MSTEVVGPGQLPRGHLSKTVEAKAIRAQMMDKALQMTADGMSRRAIAKELGISIGTATNYVNDAMESLPKENAARLRDIQNAQCVYLWDKLQAKVEAATRVLYDDDGNEVTIGTDELEKTTSTAIRLLERIAKLNGLDSPVQIQSMGVTVHLTGTDPSDLT